MTELKKGQWVQIRIPLSEVPRRQDVRGIQLHISEANYKHLDELDFYIDEIALLRYARPTLLAFAAESAVVFTDAKQIPVRFDLAGVKPDESAQVVCEIRKGEKVVASTSAKAMRGPQRRALDLSRTKLQAGEYDIVVRVVGGAETAPARVRLVESPWNIAQ